MFRTAQDFAMAYRQEGELTLACLKELTDESLSQAVSEQDRTLGEIAWHITATVGEFASRVVPDYKGLTYGTAQPATARELAQAYEQEFQSSLQAYEGHITDDNLADDVDFFGHPTPKNAFLFNFITHQVHHRGQMTVLMRQAELRVPPIYGPSRDSE